MVNILCTVKQTIAQVKYHADNMNISIKGNSNVNQWELQSDKGQLEAVFVLSAQQKITGLFSLWFTVDAETLKSGRTAMDKDAYKALKSNNFESINFVLSTAAITESAPGVYLLKCKGFLTIAGTEKETELAVDCKVNNDNTFTCSGVVPLKMSDFNIKAPSAMMGSIKAVDDISIAYSMKIVK